MTDVTQAGAEAPASIDIVNIPGDDTYISPSSAARALGKRRAELAAERAKPATEQPANGAPPAAEQVEELAQEADAAPVEGQPSGETEGKPEPEASELPPIEPPRSWTKEEKEEFLSYPREAQEKIARREQERDTATRRSQNEAAEKLKGLTAKEQAVEQARQQYESALPILLENLQSAMAGEFADIKTMADVQKMANEDFPRYVRWDAQQKQLAAVHQEIAGAQQRAAQEKQTKLSEFITREGERLADYVPEMKDPDKQAKLRASAVSILKELGFQDEELGQLGRGEKEISVHDHRLHRLLHDGVKYREMKENASKIAAKPLPPAQRPGVSRPKGAAHEAQIQNLTEQLKTATGFKAARIAADLNKAKRALAGR